MKSTVMMSVVTSGHDPAVTEARLAISLLASGQRFIRARETLYVPEHEDDLLLGLRVHAAYSGRGGERSES